jgi:iodotyrosine deiodinase
MSARVVPYRFERLSEDRMRERSAAFLETLRRRRTIRSYSTEQIPLDVVENAVAAAATAPSGANQQPWTFVVVTDPGVKRKIRRAAEEEERRSYGGRMPDEWLRALEPIGTDANKPHLEDAPVLSPCSSRRTASRPRGRSASTTTCENRWGSRSGF